MSTSAAPTGPPARPTPRPPLRVRRRRPLGPALARLVAWAAAALWAATALVLWLSADAALRLERGRERLIAGDPAGASAELSWPARWPTTRASARAGLSLADAASGRERAPVPLALLERFAPEAVLRQALARRDTTSAQSLASLLRASAHPLGPLYAAALALERGDEAGAREAAGASPVPLASRGLGRELESALALRAAGARALVRDRAGRLAAWVDAAGVLQLEAGAAALVVPSAARLRPLVLGRAAAGGVRLSLDLDLASAARDALGGRRGSIVLVEPASGAVLAAVTDERTAHKEPTAAFDQRREPASVAKLLTAAAAYRAGHDADGAIARIKCTGVAHYGGKPLWCAWPAGPLRGLDHALAVSCNVAFGDLAVLVGGPRMVDEYRRWGFDAPPASLLGAAGQVRVPGHPRELADLGVGLEMSELTPLHGALLAATIANGGRMAEPRLVTGDCGPLGLTDAPDAVPDPRGVIDASVAGRLRRAMQEVTSSGTGSGLAPLDFPVAMKTGTGATAGLGYHVNYLGFAPAENPEIAFCVRVTNEPTSPRVTRAAREVTARLLRSLAQRRLTTRQ